MIKLFEIIISNIISIPLILLSWVIPKKKGLILLTSSDGTKFKDNPKYFYLYLLKKRKTVKPYWVTKNKGLFKQLKIENKSALYLYSLKHFISVIKAEYIVCDDTRNAILYDSYFWFLGRFKNVLTWHGTGFKKIGLLDDKYLRHKNSLKYKIMYFIQKNRYKSYFLILATSKADKLRKINCFNNEKVKILGYPRNDYLINRIKNEKDSKQLKILYAPTFRESFIESRFKSEPFSKDFLENLNTKLKKKKMYFLIKKHPKDKRCILKKKYSNIKDISNMYQDIHIILPEIDILISDYSSIITDFGLTNRPIIYYIYDKKHYLSNCRSFYYDYFKICPGPFVNNEEELLNHIFNLSWFKKNEYNEEYEKFVKTFHKYKTSTSSEQLLNFLKKKDK